MLKQTSLLHQLTVAAGLTLLGAVIYTACATMTGAVVAAKLMLIILSFCHGAFSLKAAAIRSGRMTWCLAWLALTVMLWLVSSSLSIWLASYLILNWLTRSFSGYQSLLPALTDAGITALALAAAFVSAHHTHSITLTLWTYFLTQSLTVFIPPNYFSAPKTAMQLDAFESSYRSAEAALKRLN